jgi:hypothetical protein
MVGGKEHGRVVLVTPTHHVIYFNVTMLIP